MSSDRFLSPVTVVLPSGSIAQTLSYKSIITRAIKLTTFNGRMNVKLLELDASEPKGYSLFYLYRLIASFINKTESEWVNKL